MKKPPKDMGAWVRARLLNRSRSRSEDFQLVLLRYANERLLYRLSESEHGSQFVLKGATLFALWMGEPHRATRDVDLLGFGDSTEHRVQSVFEDVISLGVEDDGVRFDPKSLSVGPIREDKEYGGVRATLLAYVSDAQVRLQVDVGFGDAITPNAKPIEFPSMLGFPSPQMRAYPRETVVAEKLEAIVILGMANSRMKDFYDLATLSRTFRFSGDLLVQAIRATFERRGSALPQDLPVAFTAEFFTDPSKNTQWRAFFRKSGVSNSVDLETTVGEVVRFLELPISAAAAAGTFEEEWSPGGPWS